ncbi:acyl-CoA dehydrogenase family protein [Paraburkholderia sp. BR13439]|uniref:acyl-CoA dehydrogenase family protein n=1 Tax=Paraburkholderia TaxID=1822464 RepID=UPI0034CE2036
MNSREVATQIPTEDELVARARVMIPWLRERAAEVEAARSVPADIIEKFVEAGFFRILQPRRWGGYEMNPAVFFKVLMELGRGCCSSAWNMMILGVHPWEFGLFPQQAGDDVWSAKDDVIVASSYAPVGSVKKVEGGYIIDGKWPTSSGTDHGEWVILGAFERDDEGKPIDKLSLLLPRSDYQVIDDWHVMGLCGTGSKSLLVEKVFVPEHRTHSISDYSMDPRGSAFLFPFVQIFAGSVSAVTVGMAQGAIDHYIEQMKSRRNGTTGKPVSSSPYVKDRLANAVLLVRSARARLLQMMIETTKIVQRRELIPIEDQVLYRLDVASVGRDCQEAVQLLFTATAAKGLFNDQPIQRIMRDVMAAANHITQNADDNAGTLGGFLLGEALPPLQYSR